MTRAPSGTARSTRAVLIHIAAAAHGVAEHVRPGPTGAARVDDGVHELRVSIRTLRSLLTTYAPLLDPEPADSTRGELRWLARGLGPARDTEVVEARLSGHQLGVGTRRLVDDTVAREREAAVARAGARLASTRCAALSHLLVAFAADLRDSARHARPFPVETCAAREHTELRRLLEAHAPEGPPDDLHEVRKVAKRLRYGVSPLVEVHGIDARRLMQRARRLQDLLGEIQDSTVTQQFLRRLVDAEVHTGAQAFELGHVCAGEHRATATALVRLGKDRRKLLDSRPRWLEQATPGLHPAPRPALPGHRFDV